MRNKEDWLIRVTSIKGERTEEIPMIRLYLDSHLDAEAARELGKLLIEIADGLDNAKP